MTCGWEGTYILAHTVTPCKTLPSNVCLFTHLPSGVEPGTLAVVGLSSRPSLQPLHPCSSPEVPRPLPFLLGATRRPGRLLLLGLCQFSLTRGLRARAISAPSLRFPFCVFQEKKERRAENLRRRLENERKAEIVQVVSTHPRVPAVARWTRLTVLRLTALRPPLSCCSSGPLPTFSPETDRGLSSTLTPPISPFLRSETLPSSRKQRRSSCAPLKKETPWPCSRNSHPRGR